MPRKGAGPELRREGGGRIDEYLMRLLRNGSRPTTETSQGLRVRGLLAQSPTLPDYHSSAIVRVGKLENPSLEGAAFRSVRGRQSKACGGFRNIGTDDFNSWQQKEIAEWKSLVHVSGGSNSSYDD